MSDDAKPPRDPKDPNREVLVGPVPPEQPEARRLFVGARISVATANALARAAETLSRRTKDAGIDVRWVAPASYHVTLKFLGWARSEVISAVRDHLVVAGRGTPRITLRVARLGGLPSLEAATLVWAGVEDASGAFAALAQRIETAMVDLGFPADARPFHPHVTLGRVRESGGARISRPLKEAVLPLAEQMFGETRVDAITLFESEIKSNGSVYRDVARIDLNDVAIAPSGAAERQTREVNLVASQQTESEDTDDGWPRGQGPTF